MAVGSHASAGCSSMRACASRRERLAQIPSVPPNRGGKGGELTNYLVAMATFAGLYALMALGLNIVWGMTGLINLGLVGFFALGGYASALLTLRFGVPIVGGLAAAFIFAAACGSIMALITARLRGDYLAIVTLGFAEVVRLVASNEIWLTNGSDGISERLPKLAQR